MPGPKNKNAFTLLEIITVVVIIGVLSALAIPTYLKTVKRTQAREAEQTLLTLYAAQKRYALEHNGTYASQISALDVTIRPSSHYSYAVSATPYNGLAFAYPSGGGYTLIVNAVGQVTCFDTGSGNNCSAFSYPLAPAPLPP